MKYKTTKKITQERIKEIIRIKQSKGLTAESVLEEAKKKNNPLHDLFQWDNTKAGEQWRLQQARVFINEIKIVIDTKEYYAFENVNINIGHDSKSKQYFGRADILKNVDMRQQIITSAYNQLIYWKTKFEQYQINEFKSVMKEIDNIHLTEQQIMEKV